MLGGSTSPAVVWLCVPKDFITLDAWYIELQVCVMDACVCVCVKDPFFIRVSYPIPTFMSPRGDRANFRQIFPLSKLLAMGNNTTPSLKNPPTPTSGSARTLTCWLSLYLTKASQLS